MTLSKQAIRIFFLFLILGTAAQGIEYELYSRCEVPEGWRPIGSSAWEGEGQDCSKNQARTEAWLEIGTQEENDCRSYANGVCDDLCETDTGWEWSGDICNTNEALITVERLTSGTKSCGIWPFKKRPWRAEIRIEKECGCTCRNSPSR